MTTRPGIGMPSEQPADTRLMARAGWTVPATMLLAERSARMARWRLRLFAWLARCEAPEALALGLPSDRVVTVEQAVETE